jgi:tRNA(Ile)-lysidine synthetase-like protein
MLHRFAKQADAGLHAAYVNHGVRKNSDEDSKLIKKKCEEYGIVFHELFIDPEIFAQSGRGGFEAIAREARYDLLFELKKKLGFDFLATAHHKDDQAETVFLRIARGAGLKGLRGILAEREDKVIRPMLEFTKRDLLEYAKQNGIEWLEDSTNKNLDFFRNKVRLQILPQMESEAPGTINSLARIAILSQKIYPQAMKILDSHFNPFFIARSKCMVLLQHFSLPKAQGYCELFRLWLGGFGITWEETNEDAKFYEKLKGNKSFKFRLGRVYFERKKGFLLIYK